MEVRTEGAWTQVNKAYRGGEIENPHFPVCGLGKRRGCDAAIEVTAVNVTFLPTCP